MQITFTQRKSVRTFINYFLGPLLFIWLSYSIYHQVSQQPGLEKSWQHIRESFGGVMIWNLIGTITLMIANWSIETIKWKLAIQKIQRISFFTAFKAVLSGVSFSVTTPNRVGEYLGRVLYMEEGKRIKAISLTIAGSMSQLLITLLMGMVGLLILRTPMENGRILRDRRRWERKDCAGRLGVGKPLLSDSCDASCPRRVTPVRDGTTSRRQF